MLMIHWICSFKIFQNKGYKPLGFVTTDYALALWVDKKISLLHKILNQDEIKKALMNGFMNHHCLKETLER